MRAYSLNELFRLTRAELFALHAVIISELQILRDPERTTAIETPRRNRRLLAWPAYRP